MATTPLANEVHIYAGTGGHSAWYSGVQLLAVYAVFAVTLYLIPG